MPPYRPTFGRSLARVCLASGGLAISARLRMLSISGLLYLPYLSEYIFSDLSVSPCVLCFLPIVHWIFLVGFRPSGHASSQSPVRFPFGYFSRLALRARVRSPFRLRAHPSPVYRPGSFLDCSPHICRITQKMLSGALAAYTEGQRAILLGCKGRVGSGTVAQPSWARLSLGYKIDFCIR